MKSPTKQHIPQNISPRISYVHKANAYCVTTWERVTTSEDVVQKQTWFSDPELTKKIMFSDKR